MVMPGVVSRDRHGRVLVHSPRRRLASSVVSRRRRHGRVQVGEQRRPVVQARQRVGERRRRLGPARRRGVRCARTSSPAACASCGRPVAAAAAAGRHLPRSVRLVVALVVGRASCRYRQVERRRRRHRDVTSRACAHARTFTLDFRCRSRASEPELHTRQRAS